jgi:uncharacterized protein YabE (DUF348 family)
LGVEDIPPDPQSPILRRRVQQWPALWRAGWAFNRIALALLLLMVPRSCSPIARRVKVVVNGTGHEFYTPRRTVKGVLTDLNLTVHPEDAVYPALATGVTSGQTITFYPARWTTVVADGQVHHLRTRAKDAWDVLQALGIILRAQDRLLVNGQWVHDGAAMGGASPETSIRQITSRSPRSLNLLPSASVRLSVVRAVPLDVSVQRTGWDGEEAHHILSAAATVGEALYEAHIPVHRGDQVEPPPDSPLVAGMHVAIRRALPLTIQVDGSTIHTRTRGNVVSDVLAQEKIALWDLDYVIPAESAALSDDMAIRVVRAREETIVDQEASPFETAWVSDAELELDQRRVEEPGQPGIIARRFRFRYEDGQVITRTLEEEWRAQDPKPKIVAYGTKIVPRPIDTPNGPRSYWRKVRVLITSYTAATSGKTRDHPMYGITRLGMQMRRGIIAVDPGVINFGTQIYVPGYGIGVSADTGSAILGRRIDLGYEESDLKLWYKWMDVYLLDPPPSRSQIRWLLPDWPRER